MSDIIYEAAQRGYRGNLIGGTVSGSSSIRRQWYSAAAAAAVAVAGGGWRQR